jgi:hypothetical protein
MGKYYSAICVLALVFVVYTHTACSSKDTPSSVALSFIASVGSSNIVGIEKSLSYERLMVEKEGEAFYKMTPDQRKAAVDALRKNLLGNLTAGKLKRIGEISPGVRSERVVGDKAEVVIKDMKNKDVAYSLMLARENGVWKIYRITLL